MKQPKSIYKLSMVISTVSLVFALALTYITPTIWHVLLVLLNGGNVLYSLFKFGYCKHS